MLSWLNRFTYLTTHRVVQKNIVGGANAVVVPLGLVTGADWRQSKAQEMFDAGDIVLTHGAYDQYQRTKLKDMPDAARLHGLVAQQLQDYRRQAARQHMGAHQPFGGYGALRRAAPARTALACSDAGAPLRGRSWLLSPARTTWPGRPVSWMQW
ncbi:PH domain-containing protein [Nesterenkonia pannonica]|uniref:PH domain-containing protein n=1 Tax=Nesterenkonia pannonica TaxID=1548602 RepID=UPI002164378D|nr:PH domain-containing protein [Nesterenkonia pannonica]